MRIFDEEEPDFLSEAESQDDMCDGCMMADTCDADEDDCPLTGD